MNREGLSNLLFTSSSFSLHKLMKEKYGARSGAVSVLHTWGSNLSLHPHVHSIVPAGGLSEDKTKWISTKKSFLVHVKALSQLFKTIYLKKLKALYVKGKLFLGDNLGYLENEASFMDFIDKLFKKDWVVYSKKSFKRELQVLKYLGRYTHRIALNNHRIKNITKTHTSFTVKDYKHNGEKKLLTLTNVEFLRRYLLHVLPHGFMRIRHTGILGARYKDENIQLIRSILPESIKLTNKLKREVFKLAEKLKLPIVCHRCESGKMVAIDELKVGEKKRDFFDSS